MILVNWVFYPASSEGQYFLPQIFLIEMAEWTVFTFSVHLLFHYGRDQSSRSSTTSIGSNSF